MTADRRLTTDLNLSSVLCVVRRPTVSMRKTSLLLETDPTVSGQAPPTWVCTPSAQDFSWRGRSDRSPLHDVRQHDSIRSRDLMESKTFHYGRAKIPAGGARRDRTDDLLLAKQALSQLSYGPCGEPAFAKLRRAAFAGQRLASRSCAAAKAGGPGKI
jgi:hypothetical protein